MPPLLREHGVANIHELKRKYAKEGRSLDQVREDFRLSILATEFLQVQIKDKLKVSHPEAYEYYNANKEKYRRPAQVVWREIEVDIAKCASRARARPARERVLDRLRKGDDFARLARRQPRPDREGRRQVGDRPRRDVSTPTSTPRSTPSPRARPAA